MITRRLVRWTRGTWGILLLALGSVLGAGFSVSGATLELQARPRLRWVFDHFPVVGGTRADMVGTPTVRQDEAFTTLQFDGTDDALILPCSPLQGLNRFTIEILFRPDPDGQPEQRFFHTEDKAGRRVLMELRLESGTGHWCLDTYLHNSLDEHRTLIDRTKMHATGQWYWIALVYDGFTMAHYVNGVKELEGPVRFSPMVEGETSLGVRLNRVSWFKGQIRELRVHEEAIAANHLSR